MLGVDVGWSPTRRSSAVCRLDATDTAVTWRIARFRAAAPERETVLTTLGSATPLRVAAFDGPLQPGFGVIGRYRAAERMLTRRFGSRIGKPGQASTPVGRTLNEAANRCVEIVRSRCRVAPATHAVRIDPAAIVEAFPTAFLGVLLAEPGAIAAARGNRSDLYYEHLTGPAPGGLPDLIRHLLPGRTLALDPARVTDHDERAALVSAVTALAVARGEFVAVGDADGWIVLPPLAFIRDWALDDLRANARDEAPGCLHVSGSRLA